MQSTFSHKPSHKNRSLTHIFSVAALCTLAVTGCNKQKDNSEGAEEISEESQPAVEVETNNTVPIKPVESEPVIACDDQVAVTQLIQSIRSSVNQQSQYLLNVYGERAQIPVDLSTINSSVSSMLVDIANPVLVQSQNSSGMVTCKTSLSLTLPTKDLNQARTIYNNLGDSTLQQRMTAQNLSLNNNMLVSSAFTYVVGMQGGQSTARVVGRPPILRAVADIIAKSKFKSATDAARPASPESSNTSSEPSSPAELSEPNQPQLPNNPSQANSTQNDEANNPKKSLTSNERNTREGNIHEGNTQSSANTLKKEPNPSSKKGTDSEFDVPTDDSMDMVIIEEEGTY